MRLPSVRARPSGEETLDMRRLCSTQSDVKQAGRQEKKARGEHHLGYRGQRVVQQEDKQRQGSDARHQKSEDVEVLPHSIWQWTEATTNGKATIAGQYQ